MYRAIIAALLLATSFLHAAMTPEEAANTVILDDTGVKNLRIETVEAEETEFEETVFALGRIQIAPANRAVVSSRVPGRAISMLDLVSWRDTPRSRPDSLRAPTREIARAVAFLPRRPPPRRDRARDARARRRHHGQRGRRASASQAAVQPPCKPPCKPPCSRRAAAVLPPCSRRASAVQAARAVAVAKTTVECVLLAAAFRVRPLGGSGNLTSHP